MNINKTHNLFANITSLIEQTKNGVAITVNSALTHLYWHIGKQINDEILQNSRAEYGKEILQTLSVQLTEEYGKGYTKRNLENMLRFSKVFNNFKIVHSLSAKLTWTHFKTIIYIDDKLKRDFYIGMIKLDRWSTRTLKDRIDSQLYESEQIELLQLDKSNIHVAQYLTVLPEKKLLEAKLHKAIQNAKEKYNYKETQ